MLTHGKTWNTLRGLIAGSLLLGSAALAAPAVLADDDDDDRYGAYVYSGTIDALEDATVVEDIGELEDDDDRVEHWERLGAGQEMPDELYTEDDDLDDDDVSMETLLNEPHLVVVHETEDTDSPIIAIGVIGGDLTDDETLLIQLDEHENSGSEGRAWFGPDDDDDDDDDNDLDVIVGIYPSGAVEPLGTPEATATR